MGSLSRFSRDFGRLRSWHGPLALAVLTAALVGDALLTPNRVLSQIGADLSMQFLAWRDLGFRQWRDGHFPLWNPHLFAGAPYVGGFQSAMWYPPNWLHLLLPLAPAINALIALHLYLTGLFTYLWVASRIDRLAATVAGALMQCGGAVFLHVYAGHLPNLYTMAWVPLIFLCLDALFVRPRLTWVLVGSAAVAAQILAGHVQYVFYTAVAAGVYAVIRLVYGATAWRALAGLALMYAGGAALSAVQLLTGLAATAESVRGKPVPYQFASMFPLPPENLVTMIVPGFFGDLIHMPYWGRAYLWETSLFIGVTGAVLAVYGILRGDRRLRGVAVATAAVLLALALGSHTPLFHFLYIYAPVFGRFRGASKFAVFMMLFVVVLAAMGLDALIRTGRPHPRFIAGVSAAAAALAVGAALLWFAAGPPPARWWSNVVRAVASSGESLAPAASIAAPGFDSAAAVFAAKGVLIAAASLAVVAALLFCIRFGRWAIYAIAIFSVAEVFGYARLSRVDFDVAESRQPPLEEFLAQHPGDYRVLNLLSPDLAMWAGYLDAWGYDPGVPLRYAEFMAFTQGIPPDQATQYVPFVAPHDLYRMLRLRYVFSPLAQGDGYGMTELSRPMGHLALIYDYRIVHGRDQILAAMSATNFAPERTAILESPPLGPIDLHAPESDESSRIQITAETSDTLTIEGDLSRAALLLVTDGYSHDWRARPLEGSSQREYAIQPADYVLMGVPLQAGHHRFVLEYAPQAYVTGAWISSAAVIAWLFAVGWIVRPRATSASK